MRVLVVLVVLPLLVGCRTSSAPKPSAVEPVVGPPVTRATAPADAHPEAKAIRRTVLAFRQACEDKDAQACLDLYTPEVRKQVAPWFETDAVFDVSGKSNQGLWCDPLQREIVVTVVTVGPPHATVHANLDLSSVPETERRMLQSQLAIVELAKVEGRWLIDTPVLSPPLRQQPQQRR